MMPARAEFRDAQKTLENFDFNFNRKINRSLLFDLATGAFIARHEDGLFLGPPGTGKSHLAQAIGHAAINRGIVSSIAKPTSCSMTWPRPPSMEPAKKPWNCSFPCRF